MPRTLMFAAAVAVAVATVPAPASAASPTDPGKTLAAFASEQELADLFKRWAEAAERKRKDMAARSKEQGAIVAQSPAPAAAKSEVGEASADAITNVQHAGVDEGGIVKMHGDHLVVLRRGRLFTVRIGGGALEPVASSPAFGPDIDPGGAWYDEMLIAGDTIAVIGYSYARGGTEVGLFEISRAGRLAHKGTYHLRSNDYYSSRNYASRLIGTKLVFYSPLYLNPYAADPYAQFPAMRKWRKGATPGDFKRIAPATRIYRVDDELDPYAGVALHTVSVCDLAKPELTCESTAVMGPPGRVFYVSPTSVFVWATPGRRGANAGGASLFRIPLDGSAPSALKASGSPIDQFSFLEGDDGVLNVLVRANGRGDGMWAAESNGGGLALLRVPLASFSDGRDSAPPGAYRPMPQVAGYALQNRYVGEYLLYGAGTGWNRPQATAYSQLYAVRYASGDTFAVSLPHAVDRIEALGRNAVAVGSDGKDLHFTSVRLARQPMAIDRYTRRDAAQGETRSHGFFYKPAGEDDGVLGLPIVGGSEPGARQLRKESAALLYVRNRALAFSELGLLEARPTAAERNDGCVASCVDWYGNSRPLFVGSRVFALMGYEIVEGSTSDTRIVETRRTSFAPRLAEIAR
ncbi:MAG: beta-propeller domain-containing protein [Burkholderiales bacterium]